MHLIFLLSMFFGCDSNDDCISICHDDNKSCLEDCLEDFDCEDECDGAQSDCLSTCD